MLLKYSSILSSNSQLILKYQSLPCSALTYSSSHGKVFTISFRYVVSVLFFNRKQLVVLSTMYTRNVKARFSAFCRACRRDMVFSDYVKKRMLLFYKSPRAIVALLVTKQISASVTGVATFLKRHQQTGTTARQ